jgi:hypothetical protein
VSDRAPFPAATYGEEWLPGGNVNLVKFIKSKLSTKYKYVKIVLFKDIHF